MDEKVLDNVFSALADVTRRRIIDHLQAEGEQSLYQICTQLIMASQATGGRGLSRQAISQHLGILERAGIVRITWSGRTKLHSIDLKPLQDAANDWLKARLP
jgi:DNA-binding transcriptional ArsR family regulator